MWVLAVRDLDHYLHGSRVLVAEVLHPAGDRVPAGPVGNTVPEVGLWETEDLTQVAKCTSLTSCFCSSSALMDGFETLGMGGGNMTENITHPMESSSLPLWSFVWQSKAVESHRTFGLSFIVGWAKEYAVDIR